LDLDGKLIIIGNKVIRGSYPDYANVEGVYSLKTIHRHPKYKKWINKLLQLEPEATEKPKSKGA